MHKIVGKNLLAVLLVIVNGGWSQWSDFGGCSKTCGGGTRSKTRACSNPRPTNGGATCSGPELAIERCNVKECPGKNLELE